MMIRVTLSLLALLALLLAAPVALAADGDVNGDGAVDAADVEALQAAIGTSEGDDGYSAAGDHDGDGVISAADLAAQLRLPR